MSVAADESSGCAWFKGPAQAAFQRDRHEQGSKVMTRMAHETGALEEEAGLMGVLGAANSRTAGQRR